MTPAEQELTLALATARPGVAPLDPVDYLHRLGVSDGTELSLDVLRDAIARRDAGDVEMGVILTSVFGLTDRHLAVLCELAHLDWHTCHEDVARMLGQLRAPAAVPALVELARWVPEHLRHDEGHALARKAVHALGWTPGPEAEQALREIASVGADTVRETALKQLARRTPDDGIG